ncbi:hypothetical protein [Natronosalvus rutilus]|uniref:Uncharacterized protein n=1 Tax=Natronosalvus rutilus TaxID=2953753 RepID=A0A9E7N9F9_9EURY|nr:hypothetical protein [Natronosalvus rutilus]UTF52730.1 hypothetical protein NGM29_13185 [Natronosalvus rutilus]
MAVETQSATIANAIADTATIDLADFVPGVPSGTDVEVTVAGDRSSYTIDFERRADRYVIKGASGSAELTAVYGDGVGRKPDRVPDWIVAVLAVMDINEVSVQR